jgi:type IV secretion system protein VirB3
MLGGAPREFAILNGAFGAVLFFGLHSFLGIPLFILLQTGAVLLSRHDPYFLDTFRRHINHKHYYGA